MSACVVGAPQDLNPWPMKISTTFKLTAGLQYSNKWNDKQTLNLAPKYNNQIYTNNNKRVTQTQIGENQSNESKSTTLSNVSRSNFKLNATYDVKLDTLNSIKFTARTNFYNTESDEFTDGTTTGSDGLLKNKQQKRIIAMKKHPLIPTTAY